MGKNMSALEFDLQHLTKIDLHATPPQILVADDLSVQYLFDGKVLAFKAFHATREVVDAWVAYQIEYGKKTPVNQIVYTLHDFSAPGCQMTPYVRHKNAELRKNRTAHRIYTVSVMQRGAAGLLAQTFTKLLNDSKLTAIVTFNLDDGLLWLQNIIKQNEMKATEVIT
jgi:hypothetical protein